MSLAGIFVVGTDTGVGKTRVAAAIAGELTREGRRVGVLKPVATGVVRAGATERCDDAERLAEAVGGGVPLERVTPIRFEEPLAPPVAARRAGAPLSRQDVEGAVASAIGWWAERVDVLVVEGVGGLLCPLAEGSTVADLASALDFPLVVVARRALGTLNHTLLTVEAATLRGLRIAGLILNSPEPPSDPVVEATNAEELSRRIPGIPLLAEIPHEAEAGGPLPGALRGVDWYERVQPPRLSSLVPDRPERASGRTVVSGPWRGVQRPMASDVIEPPPGASQPERSEPGPVDPSKGEPEIPSGELPSLTVPAPVAGGSSCDELSLSLAQPRPDPMLGALDQSQAAGPEAPRQSGRPSDPAGASAPGSLASGTPPGGAAQGQGPTRGAAGGGSPAGSYDPITGAILSADAGGKSSPFPSNDVLSSLGIGEDLLTVSGDQPARDATPAGGRGAPGTHEEDEDAPRGLSWTTVLLASYASAVTIGLVWVLWTGRRVKDSPEQEAPVAVEARPDPGVRADRSRRLVAPPPIAAEHLTTLGKPVRMGVIEITPVEVTSGPVVLERTLAGHQIKTGGRKALKLRLRIRNVSSDTRLAPLDEAFLREGDRAEPDSFIETSKGGPPIAMYPLAVHSEWSIDGQEFRELNPGEELDTQVISEPNATGRTAPEMTWRVRLRTDINHTDDLGVRFRDSDVRPER
jgi:dethiobiotin synthetase